MFSFDHCRKLAISVIKGKKKKKVVLETGNINSRQLRKENNRTELIIIAL